MIVRASGLATSGFADERERLARAHVEGHPVDGAGRTVAAGILHVEVAHLDKRSGPFTRSPASRHVDARGLTHAAGRPQLDRRARTPPRLPSSGGGRDIRSGRRGGLADPLAGRTGSCGTRARRSPKRRECARVGMRAVGEDLASFGPSSTIRPAYMTAIRRHTLTSVERSCVMKMIASPELALEVAEQPEHLRLHHHVERGRGLVGDQEAPARRRAPARSGPAGAGRSDSSWG